jgi:hypothetical protein
LDNDSNLDLFIGQDLGGLFYLENDSLSNLGLNNTIHSFPEINIYPNPATNEIIISSSFNNHDVEIMIYASSGKLVAQKRSNLIKDNISISNFSSGMYFIRIPELGFATKFIKQ